MIVHIKSSIIAMHTHSHAYICNVSSRVLICLFWTDCKQIKLRPLHYIYNRTLSMWKYRDFQFIFVQYSYGTAVRSIMSVSLLLMLFFSEIFAKMVQKCCALTIFTQIHFKSSIVLFASNGFITQHGKILKMLTYFDLNLMNFDCQLKISWNFNFCFE